MNIGVKLSDRNSIFRWSVHGKSYLGIEKVGVKGIAHNMKFSLYDAFLQRESSKQFSDEDISLDELGSVLSPAIGRNRRKGGTEGTGAIMRAAYPSAGGLYPIETYVVISSARHDKDIESAGSAKTGIYHFDNLNNTFSKLAELPDDRSLGKALNFGRNTPPKYVAAIVLTSVFPRTTEKYGGRGYRFALLEAGHMAQNILLACAPVGINACCWGGYTDDKLEEMLGVDGIQESVVHCVLLGKAS